MNHASKTAAAGRRVLWVSLGILFSVTIIQAIIVSFTGSLALLGDTLHTFTDALTALPLILAFHLASKPPTRKLTYGYGRAEDLSGIVIVLALAGSTFYAAYETYERFLHPQPVQYIGAVIAAGLLGALSNEGIAQYRIRTGRRIGSASLEADGLHARSDGLISVGVTISAIMVSLGMPWADTLVSALIVIALAVVTVHAALHIGRRLMDVVDPATSSKVADCLLEHPEIIAVQALRLRWVGHELRGEATLQIDGTHPVQYAHKLSHEIETAAVSAISHLTNIHVHLTPHNETACEINNFYATETT